jgi:uncharacterized protein
VYYVLGALSMLLAAGVQGVTGFGSALVAVPLLVFFVPYEQIPPTIAVLMLANNLLMLSEMRAHVRPRLALPLGLAGIAGLPLGAFLLTQLNAPSFKLAVGVIVLALALPLLIGWRLKLPEHWGVQAVAGFFAGLLGGATSLSGPPVILFLANRGEAKQDFRANLVFVFAMLNVAGIMVFSLLGLMTPQVWLNALGFVPGVLLGTYGGMLVARRLSEGVFRRAVLLLLAILAAALIAGSLRG